MAVFDLLRSQMWFTFYCISTAVNGKVSLDRLDDFLHNTELLDSFISKETPEIIAPNEPSSNAIGFKDATFAWSNDEIDGTLTPSSRKFLLKIEGELLFRPGCVNLVLGPTGSVRRYPTLQFPRLISVGENIPSYGSSRLVFAWFLQRVIDNIAQAKCISYHPLFRRGTTFLGKKVFRMLPRKAGS
jgi:hypothetical protein